MNPKYLLPTPAVAPQFAPDEITDLPPRDGRQPSLLAWLLKDRLLPFVYWKAMLKGREWVATPELIA